ncbi:hypothetical protein DDI_2362 [Dickeya dianthicola RNS04.9]|nr:hypothetical protein DDI_2362 [Dickeya dianthicola RNS04.9]
MSQVEGISHRKVMHSIVHSTGRAKNPPGSAQHFFEAARQWLMDR